MLISFLNYEIVWWERIVLLLDRLKLQNYFNFFQFPILFKWIDEKNPTKDCDIHQSTSKIKKDSIKNFTFSNVLHKTDGSFRKENLNNL